MATLKLFGMDLTVSRGQVAQPVGPKISIAPGDWEARLLAGGRNAYKLELRGHIVWDDAATISFRLFLRYVKSGSRYIIAENQSRQPNNTWFGYWGAALSAPPGGPKLQLSSGVIGFGHNELNGRIHGTGGDLAVSFEHDTAWVIETSSLPIRVLAGSGGLAIDLNAGLLTARPGMFDCVTSAVHGRTQGRGHSYNHFFVRRHASVEHTFDLAKGFHNPDLTFLPKRPNANEVGFLSLHTDHLDRRGASRYSKVNPVVAPLGLIDYRLDVGLVMGRYKPLLQRIVARPRRATGGVLWSFAVAGLKKNAPDAYLFDEGIELVARVDAVDAPSTLMIAPVYDPDISGGRPMLPVRRGSEYTVHGIVPDAVFHVGTDCHVQCAFSKAGRRMDPRRDQVAQLLVYDLTLPTLISADNVGIDYPRPGHAYVRDEIAKPHNSIIDVWRFRVESGSPNVVLPLLPLSMVAAGGTDPSTVGGQYLSDANLRASKYLRHTIDDVQHEGFMREGPAQNDPDKVIRLSRPYIPGPPPDVSAAAPSLSKKAAKGAAAIGSLTIVGPSRNRIEVRNHPIAREYGPYAVEHVVSSSTPPDYVLFRDDIPDNVFTAFPDVTQPNARIILGMDEFKIKERPKPDPRVCRPLAILKLSGNISLEEIFNEEGLSSDVPDLGPTKDLFRDVIDPTIQTREWTGLVMFNLPLDLGDFQILEDLVGESALVIQYLAVTAEKTAGTTGSRAFSYTGAIRWKNQNPPPPPPKPGNSQQEKRESETTFTAVEVDVAWRDNDLTNFYFEGVVAYETACGIWSGDDKKLEIIGSYDKDEKKFRFLGRLPRKLPIISSDNNYGPIEQIYVKSAEIIQENGRTTINLDGEMDCRPVNFDGNDWFQFPPGDSRLISFKGLGLRFSKTPLGGPEPQWLRFNYPSFKLDPNIPQFNLFGLDWLQLKIQKIGFDIGNKFDWGGLASVYRSGDFDYGALVTDVRLNFGKLPELFARKFKELMFDFSIGVGYDGFNTPKIENTRLRIGLRGVGFKGLNLDLMRFLTLRADKLEFGTKDISGQPVAKMDIVGLELLILEKQIISDMTLSMYGTPKGKKALLAFFGPGGGGTPQTGILDIYWTLIGRNLRFSDELVKGILSIDSRTDQGDHNAVARTIKNSIDDDSILPIDGDGIGEWLFAAGFGFFDEFVVGKFLFQDKAYYGIAVRGEFLRKWFGYDLAISVVYFKRDRPEEDSFYIQVRVPAVDLATFRFTGGVIAVEIFVNGGFVLDVGFPWLDRFGARMWSRTFGAFITPFQGSGGFYLGYRKTTKLITGDKVVQVVGGYAVQGGLGASFGGGIFRVWVRAGLYVVLEGALVLRGKDLAGLKLVGAVGVFVEGAGELNWWVISVRVGIFASAEARATIVWGLNPDNPNLGQNGDLVLYLDFALHARASADACIGSGWFKLCKGINVSVTMPFQHMIKLK